jgi:biopolymer transport protein ExbD
MGGGAKATTAVAVVLILLGISLPLGYRRWLETRTFVALHMPILLSADNVKSGDFTVNLSGWYQIAADVDSSFPFRSDCGLGGSPPLLKVRSTLYRDSVVPEQMDGSDRFLGHFYAESGEHYRLNVHVLTDASCLNSGNPRVVVWTGSDFYEYLNDVLLAGSVVLFLSGLGLLVFSLVCYAEGRAIPQPGVAISENAKHAYYPFHRRLPLKKRFALPASFGLLYAIMLGTVLTPSFLIFFYAWGYGHRSVGIPVRLVRPSPLRAPSDFIPPPLVVRVTSAGAGSRPQVYLNSKPVGWEDLAPLLKSELKSRAEWFVYVEADSDLAWGDAVNAMDIIRGTGAQVVFLTIKPTPLPTNSRRDRGY